MIELTISLSDQPLGILFLQISSCLRTQRCCAGEKCPDAAQVIFSAGLLVGEHSDDDWRHLGMPY